MQILYCCKLYLIYACILFIANLIYGLYTHIIVKIKIPDFAHLVEIPNGPTLHKMTWEIKTNQKL